MLFSIFKEFYEIKSSLTLFICYLFVPTPGSNSNSRYVL